MLVSMVTHQSYCVSNLVSSRAALAERDLLRQVDQIPQANVGGICLGNRNNSHGHRIFKLRLGCKVSLRAQRKQSLKRWESERLPPFFYQWIPNQQVSSR